MPTFCNRCNLPIVFVDFQAAWPTKEFRGGRTVWQNKDGEKSKSVPINIDADPSGSIILYEFPTLCPGSANDERNAATPRQTFARRVNASDDVRRMYARAGISFYKIHFDTCKGRDSFRPSRFSR